MVKTTLKVEGMMCSMCEAHMNDMIRENFAVKKVTSSAKDGETVVLSEEVLDLEKVRQKIEGLGYKLLDSSSGPYEKKKFFSFGK